MVVTMTARSLLVAMTATAMAVAPASATVFDAKVTQYTVQSADAGSCRLKGISTSSDNFKYYASVSAKDVSVNDGCARCITVSKDNSASVTAYVLDVCQGCKSGELKLSSSGLQTLQIDANTNNATAKYQFVNCPASFLTGSVSACLMEGASNSYIPLQFYNSQKIIASANISGIAATQNKDAFFYFSTPNTGNSNSSKWYSDVKVTVKSKDGETQSGSFQFSGNTGCATSTFQFSKPSVPEGGEAGGSSDDSGSKSGSSSKSGLLIGVIVGGVCALLLIVAAVFLIRRRRANSKYDDDLPRDTIAQFQAEQAKGGSGQFPQSPDRPTYAVDNSMHNSTDDPSEPNSPMVAFDESVTPAAVEAANRRVFESINNQRQQQQQEFQQQQLLQQQQQQQQLYQQQQQRAAPKVAHTTYVAPITYSYSKPLTDERPQKGSSLRGSTRNAGPTFPAPKLPTSHAREEEEGRSSFDIDDMRQTEEIKERELMSSGPYSSDSTYAAPTVTSPQSYVRATTLRRTSTKVPTDRPTLRFTSTPAPAQVGANDDERRSGSFDFSDRDDSYASVNREKGYSQESLGILGYPYAKKNSGRGSMSGK